MSGNRLLLPEPGAGRGHRAHLGARRQQGQGRARGQRRRRRSACRRGRLPRHAEGGREACQGQVALAAGAWWSTRRPSARTHRSSSPTRATCGWELDFFAFRWTGIDDADAVTFNVTEC